MWQLLRNLLYPRKAVTIHHAVDFTHPRRDRWAKFEGGTNLDACFAIRGFVRKGEDILVRMQSGRIGRYCIFSIRRDFTGVADWKVKAVVVGYEPIRLGSSDKIPEQAPPPEGSSDPQNGRVQSNSSQLALIPHGFTLPGSEFWKVLARDEARRVRTNSLRTGGDL